MQKRLILKKFYKHIILFLIFAVLGWYMIVYIQDDKRSRYLDMQAKLLETKYKTNYRYFKIMSKDIQIMYADNKDVIYIFSQAKSADTKTKAKLRKQLYDLLKKRYTRLERMGVNQLQFHLPDNTSFLRMNHPQFFGDDLSSARYGVVKTNKTKTVTEGFEVGKIVEGFRFIHPFYDFKKHYIGSLEVSFSSEQLLKNILDNNIYDAHLLISKKEFQKMLLDKSITSQYTQTWESKDFMLEKSTHMALEEKNLYNHINDPSLTQKIEQYMQKKKAFALSTALQDRTIVLSFVPIKNIQGTQIVAYIVTYTKSDYLDNITLEEYYLKILFYAVLFLIFIFGIYVIINKEKLKEMAHFDNLTKLPNRSYFYMAFDNEINRAKRNKKKFALLFIDLDGFKAINDTYGHNVGDLLLIEVAHRLKSTIRISDTVARLGGDEFTIILTDLKEVQETQIIAQKIIDELNKEFIIDENKLCIGASIGIAIYPEHGKDMDTLIQNSDDMMYVAKKSGKNISIIYEKGKKHV